MDRSNCRQPVQLDENGNVTCLHEYNKYELIVGGDLADCEGMDIIELSKGNKTDSYGIKFIKGDLEFYNLVLETLPDEKPVYKPGKLAFRLNKIK